MISGPVIAIVKAAFAVSGAAYAVYGIRLFLMQNSIVFKVSRTLSGDPGTVGLEFEDVFLKTPGGISVHSWWIPGQTGSKVVLFFPGSIGNLSSELGTFAFLASLGATVMAIDYPGFGKSGGSPSEAGCYRSAQAAWDFAVRVKGVEPQNIILFGRSVGAAVAAWLAAQCACACLICHGGPSSVPDVAAQRYRFVPSRWFCYIRFNTVRSIETCRSPVLVMHSSSDLVIPVRHGIRIFEAAPLSKRFLPLIGDHYGNEWQATPGLRDVLKPIIECGSLDLTCYQDYAL